jgi:ATP-binding cassette subfamily F protein uup
MPLFSIDNLSIAFGAEKLLDGASFQLEAGERVCLIGRNGTGKTTLLRLLADELHPDGGDIWRQPGLRVATLAQELPADTTATVFEIVAGGLEGLGALLAEYHEAAIQLAHAVHARSHAQDGTAATRFGSARRLALATAGRNRHQPPAIAGRHAVG